MKYNPNLMPGFKLIPVTHFIQQLPYIFNLDTGIRKHSTDPDDISIAYLFYSSQR